MGPIVFLGCTDFQIFEPKPLDLKWNSFKFNGPASRYEIAISILSGVVWAHGHFECGMYNILAIYRQKLQIMPNPDEFVVADRGYTHRTDTKN